MIVVRTRNAYQIGSWGSTPWNWGALNAVAPRFLWLFGTLWVSLELRKNAKEYGLLVYCGRPSRLNCGITILALSEYPSCFLELLFGEDFVPKTGLHFAEGVLNTF